VLPFHYVRPRTSGELFDLLAQHGPAARLLAGGTDLLVRLRLGHIRPTVVVDIKQLTAPASTIVESNGLIRIGAGAVMTDIIADPRVGRHFPALIEAAAVVGSVQIRNRATLAGNICNASPAADTAPSLLVYGAIVNLVSAGAERQVRLEDFFTGPGRTVMKDGEMVASIDLPVPAAATGAAFGRITRRYGVDLATINLSCLVTDTGETRFAFGAVAPRPLFFVDRTGTLANPEAARDAREAVLADMLAHTSPISDVRADRDYRVAMLDVMSRRALDSAIARLRGRDR
jgi:CO/xanthine dehydrogenase FAD-binding subunit